MIKVCVLKFDNDGDPAVLRIIEDKKNIVTGSIIKFSGTAALHADYVYSLQNQIFIPKIMRLLKSATPTARIMSTGSLLAKLKNATIDTEHNEYKRYISQKSLFTYIKSIKSNKCLRTSYIKDAHGLSDFDFTVESIKQAAHVVFAEELLYIEDRHQHNYLQKVKYSDKEMAAHIAKKNKITKTYTIDLESTSLLHKQYSLQNNLARDLLTYVFKENKIIDDAALIKGFLNAQQLLIKNEDKIMAIFKEWIATQESTLSKHATFKIRQGALDIFKARVKLFETTDVVQLALSITDRASSITEDNPLFVEFKRVVKLHKPLDEERK